MKTVVRQTRLWGTLVAVFLVVGVATPLTTPALPQQPGSSRQKQIARPVASKAAELIFLAGSMSDDEIAQLRKSAPNLRVIAGLSRDEALQLAPEVQGIFEPSSCGRRQSCVGCRHSVRESSGTWRFRSCGTTSALC